MATSLEVIPASVELVEPLTSTLEVIRAYRAASIIADEVQSSTWSQFVRYVIGYSYMSPDELTSHFKSSEKDAKITADEGTLPAAYRSAKSTILAAWRLGVPLWDGYNVPFPKSVVAATIAAKQASAVEAETPEETIIAAEASPAGARAVQSFERAAERLKRVTLTETEARTAYDAARVAMESIGVRCANSGIRL